MAQVPYEHIESPGIVRIDGVRAFNPGDPIPVETARALGLLAGGDAPPILPAYGTVPEAFVDGEITLAPDADSTSEAPPSDPTPPEGATTTPPTGDATTATPPQAPAAAPPQGRRTTPTA